MGLLTPYFCAFSATLIAIYLLTNDKIQTIPTIIFLSPKHETVTNYFFFGMHFWVEHQNIAYIVFPNRRLCTFI